MRYVVGNVSELPSGTRKIVYPRGGQGVGVFNVGDRFYALKNVCPHQGAQLCLGRVTGTTAAHRPPEGAWELKWERDGEIITCPWHRWEFELATGRTIFPSRSRVATYDVSVERAADVSPPPDVEIYPVSVEDGVVVLELPDR